MATISSFLPMRPSRSKALRGRAWRVGAVFATTLSIAGCAVELQNTQPAQELAQQSKPPGSVHTGWRVFQDRCAACHGPDAAGTAAGPDLIARVRDMGPQRFVGLVLDRYDWKLPAAQSGGSGATRDALVEYLVQRRAYMLSMPAWQGEPRVSAHIVDLFAYLSARSQGTQGPGRPTPEPESRAGSGEPGPPVPARPVRAP